MGGPPPPGTEDGGFAGAACITLSPCVQDVCSAARGTHCSACAREAEVFMRWQHTKTCSALLKCHSHY